MTAARLFIISGPSAVGKVRCEADFEVRRQGASVGVGDDAESPGGEEEGVSYYFMSAMNSLSKLSVKADFSNTPAFTDTIYGTPKAPVMSQLKSGMSFWKSTFRVRAGEGELSRRSVIFILPPSKWMLSAAGSCTGARSRKKTFRCGWEPRKERWESSNTMIITWSMTTWRSGGFREENYGGGALKVTDAAGILKRIKGEE